MKEPIKEVVRILDTALRQESQESNTDWVTKVINDYRHLDLNDPEHFGLLLSGIHGDREDDLADHVLRGVDIDDVGREKLSFVYRKYEFIERHVEALIERHDGWVIVTDKTRYLIAQYIGYIKTGELPDDSQQDYYSKRIPRVNDWLLWIDTMYDMYNGESNGYVERKQVLEDMYRDRAKEARERGLK